MVGYSYDGENRPLTVGSNNLYNYCDGDGARVSRFVGTTETQYVGQTNENNPTNTPTVYCLFGGITVAMKVGQHSLLPASRPPEQPGVDHQ